MNELVHRLSVGEHPVSVGGPQPSLSDFRTRLEEMNYIFIKFTNTGGGTDLGVRIEKTAIEQSMADFDQGSGVVHVEGTLTLNYVKVRCVADIDLQLLQGTGHLVILEEVHP